MGHPALHDWSDFMAAFQRMPWWPLLSRAPSKGYCICFQAACYEIWIGVKLLVHKLPLLFAQESIQHRSSDLACSCFMTASFSLAVSSHAFSKLLTSS